MNRESFRLHNKNLIILFLIAFAGFFFFFCNQIVDDFYVMDRANKYVEGMQVPITEDRTMSKELTLFQRTKGIVVQLVPSESGDNSFQTVIDMIKDGECIWSETITNGAPEPPGLNGGSYFAINDGVQIKKGDKVTIRVSSNAKDDRDARCVAVDYNGDLWCSSVYLWITKWNAILAGAIILTAIFLVAMLLIFNVKLFDDTNRAFVIVSLVICTMYVVVSPAFSLPDERQHSIKAGSILRGYLFSEDYPVQHSFMDNSEMTGGFQTNIHYALRSENDRKERISLTSTASPYNPHVYLPQALAMGMADFFSDNALLGILLGKIASGIASTVFICLAVWKSPRYKNIIAYSALLPLSIQQRSGISVDPYCIVMGFAFFSYVFYLSQKERITKRDMIDTGVMVFLLSSGKPMYFVLTVLLWLIPAKLFLSQRMAVLYRICFPLFGGLVSALWVLLSRNLIMRTTKWTIMVVYLAIIATVLLRKYLNTHPGINYIVLFIPAVIVLVLLFITTEFAMVGQYDIYGATQGNAGGSEQIKQIFQQPVQYALMLTRGLVENIYRWFIGMMGVQMNSRVLVNGAIPILFMMGWVIVVWLDTSQDADEKIWTKSKLLLLTGTCLAAYVIVATIMFIGESVNHVPISSGLILLGGVQDRYFIPLLPLFGILVGVGINRHFILSKRISFDIRYMYLGSLYLNLLIIGTIAMSYNVVEIVKG